MKSLFEYPAAYPPRMDGQVSSTARIWCLGGLLWLGVALLAFLCAAIKMSWVPGWLSGYPVMSIGVLRQIGESALLYGWGLPFLFGISLLIVDGKGLQSDSLDRAGAWMWHFLIAWGLICLGVLKGSGIAGMPFPAYLWPVLIMAALPVCRSQFNAYFSFHGQISLSRNIIFSSHLLTLLLLTGGFVYVFLANTHPYYMALAAKSVQSGLALGVLGGFALACIRFSSGSVAKIPVTAGTILYLLGVCFILMIDFVVPAGPWYLHKYMPCLFYLMTAVLVLFALAAGRRKNILPGALAFVLVILWGRMDLWMLLLIVLFGGLGSVCFRVLGMLLPRCGGCDWILPGLMKRGIKAFRVWLVVWLILVALEYFDAARSDGGLSDIYGAVINLMLLGAVIVYAVFLAQVLPVWLGAGRLNARPSLNEESLNREGRE